MSVNRVLFLNSYNLLGLCFLRFLKQNKRVFPVENPTLLSHWPLAAGVSQVFVFVVVV